MPVQVRSAHHIGRTHLLEGVNYQDSLQIIRGKDDAYVAGVICDGGSKGKDGHWLTSEVGAGLGAAYLGANIRSYMECFWMSPELAAQRLDGRLDVYISRMIAPYSNMDDALANDFMVQYLLFTVIGFIWTPEQTAFFYLGDGTVQINDTLRFLNPGDTPDYIAYRHYRYGKTDSRPSNPMMTVEVYNEPVTRLMIGSDAFKSEPDCLPELLGADNLQRELNRLSDIQHHFRDDVSLIALEVLE